MKTTATIIIALLLCLGLFLGFASFLNEASAGPDTEDVSVITPVAYGNGVYYFPCTGKNFATSLSDFIENSIKDDVEIKTMTSNGTGVRGADKGYFVVVAKK